MRSPLPLLALAFASVAGLAGCGGEARDVREERAAAQPSRSPAAPAPLPAAPSPLPAASDERPLVVFLGDSLTAGLGLEQEEAFPARVAELLAAEGRPIRALNAGVSGDTSAGGLRRLDWLLRQKPAVVVVGLGANDGLRGLPPEETERNLREIVRRSRAAGVQILLLGLQIPPNYGPEYAGRFTALYPRIAADLEVPLVPFLLEGVGGDPELNQADGIHPTAEGQRRLAENVAPYLRELLESERGAAAR